MSETLVKNLDDLLMVSLSYKHYINLSAYFEESPKMRTAILRNPKTAYMKHLIALSRLLAEDDNSRSIIEWFEHLITEYSFATDNTTVDEVEVAKAGLEAQNGKEAA
ncbi:MAG TPA: hypothetical protein VI757_11695 [Bacteroidia bacterium]|nr:hypothetical protein [Bacteroidia bacterium]